jgi:hypothetical protein
MLIPKEQCSCRVCGKGYQQLQAEYNARLEAGKLPVIIWSREYHFSFQVCDFETGEQINICGPCLFRVYDLATKMVRDPHVEEMLFGDGG